MHRLARRIPALGIAAVLLSASAAQAPIVLEGEYDLLSFVEKDGKPACTERWSFGKNGALTVHSGEEVVHKRFRVETDEAGSWLVMNVLSTNGRPDCFGQVTLETISGEYRYFIYRAKDGGILACNRIQMADPSRAPILDCLAHLYARP